MKKIIYILYIVCLVTISVSRFYAGKRIFLNITIELAALESQTRHCQLQVKSAKNKKYSVTEKNTLLENIEKTINDCKILQSEVEPESSKDQKIDSFKQILHKAYDDCRHMINHERNLPLNDQ